MLRVLGLDKLLAPRRLDPDAAVTAALRRRLPPALLEPGGGAAPVATGRSRPRYFDGRFLAARDLERDQRYVAERLAEHLRAAGDGVIHGLDVAARDETTLTVDAGAAITPGGRLVVLRAPLVVPLADAAETQRLDRELGLLAAPRDVPRRRTGVFVLLARPFELTADPIGLYPAAIDERRSPEDGAVVEATAVTLAPYHDAAIDVEPARQRGALARRVFVERREEGWPVEAVPLAAVQLERGFVRWIDPWLVRREIGPAHQGAGPRAAIARARAEAHVHQYLAQLADAVAARRDTGRPAGFAATEEVAGLPPFGAIPAASLDLRAAAERFFPPAVPVALAVVPDDELASIADEALALAPIDLRGDEPALAAAPVAVLVPAPRARVAQLDPDLRGFPLRSTAVAAGRRRAGAALADGAPGERAAGAAPDPRGAELADELGDPDEVFYVRLRRAAGGTLGGVVAITRQEV